MPMGSYEVGKVVMLVTRSFQSPNVTDTRKGGQREQGLKCWDYKK